MGRAHPREEAIWIQVNAALFPATAERPFVPWASLATAVEQWRAAGHFARFYFARKPPGLRLRFAGHNLGERLEPALAAWLSAAERRNDIRGFRFTGYEPERRRFGGKTGMGIAHDLFDGDAALALRFEAGTATGDRAVPVSRRLLSLAICQDLFVRTLDDGAEVWDVWKGLEEAVRGAAGVASRSEASQPGASRSDAFQPGASRSDAFQPGASRSDAFQPGASQPDASQPEASQPDAFRPDAAALAEVRAFLAAPGPEASGLIDPARVTNARVSSALRAAAGAGRLGRGPRKWLTAAAVFHWNRWGLPLELALLGSSVAAMAELTEPDSFRVRP